MSADRNVTQIAQRWVMGILSFAASKLRAAVISFRWKLITQFGRVVVILARVKDADPRATSRWHPSAAARCPQRSGLSLDRSIDAREHNVRDLEVERPRGLQVEHHFVFDRRLHR